MGFKITKRAPVAVPPPVLVVQEAPLVPTPELPNGRIVDATGFPIQESQRVYVPARPYRDTPSSWDPVKKTGGSPSISGAVLRTYRNAKYPDGVVVVRAFDTQNESHVLASEVRVQTDRTGTIEACEFFLRRAQRADNRGEALELESKLARLMTQRDRQKARREQSE